MKRNHVSPTGSQPRHPLRATGWRALAPLTLLCGALLTPAFSAPQLQVLDAEQLIRLALSRPELVIIDSRLPTDRVHGFIEGSINLPDVDTDCDSLARLVPSTATPVAFYCNGPRCDRSARAGDVALGCGYRASYWFRGGFEEWLRKGYPTLRD